MTDYLLDANALIWAMDAPEQLGPAAMAALTDPSGRLVVVVGTMWEIGIKVGLGKLRLSLPLRDWLTQSIVILRMEVLPITIDVIDAQAGLPQHHRDPFDRLLVAQAMVGGMPVVSKDDKLDRYGITRIW